jgi:hypothetical protein
MSDTASRPRTTAIIRATIATIAAGIVVVPVCWLGLLWIALAHGLTFGGLGAPTHEANQPGGDVPSLLIIIAGLTILLVVFGLVYRRSRRIIKPRH